MSPNTLLEGEVQFHVLGDLAVTVNGVEVQVPAQKPRKLLSILLSRAGQSVPVPLLSDILWTKQPKNPRKAMQVYVFRLRHVLGHDRIQQRGEGYAVVTYPGELDVHRFEALGKLAMNAKMRRDLKEMGRHSAEALDTWRGMPYVDLAESAVAAHEVSRLEELRTSLLELRIGADIGLGKHFEAIPELRSLIMRFPFRERFRILLMLALYRTGRQGEALEVFQETLALLDRELGILPGRETSTTHTRILQSDPFLMSADAVLECLGEVRPEAAHR
ncbi:AfsR/SARP family transcriptional regulator [Streptosporangium sp. DT93]|uniref:AfsR/SARP family transcriptional regulator n=1 Tax=Streptosporangium sp. DT93 TaxID=3393428 RepID=UPI003CEBB716